MKHFTRFLVLMLLIAFSSQKSNATWTVEEKKDDFTDKLISIYATNFDEMKKATLIFGCYRLPVSPSLQILSTQIPALSSLDVKLRVGTGVPVEKTWELIGWRSLTIDDESWRSMLEANGGTVAVGFKIFGDVYKFDLSGMKQKVDQVSTKCKTKR